MEIQMPRVKLPGAHENLYHHDPDEVALLAFLFGDELERKVADYIKLNCDSESALSVEQRAARLKEIEESPLQAHRERAAFVEAIVTTGRKATHRHDAPIPAVLGITVSTDISQVDPLAI